MPKMDSTFLARLEEAFSYRGINTQAEKIGRLMDATGRTHRTAKRWLAGKTYPRFHVIDIANNLNIDCYWLFDGRGHPPAQWDFIEKMNALPPEQRKYVANKITRLGILLLNKSPKATRWMHMFDQGELSGEQFLAML